MNKSFLMMNLSLGLLLFGCISFGMNTSNNSFNLFSQLQPELQLQIFVHTNNKTSFQDISKDWSIRGSIKNSDIFSKDRCDIMYAQKDGLQRMCGILLYAIYKQNYQGVENILKYSGILERFDNRIPYHYIDRDSTGSHVLHP